MLNGVGGESNGVSGRDRNTVGSCSSRVRRRADVKKVVPILNGETLDGQASVVHHRDDAPFVCTVSTRVIG